MKELETILAMHRLWVQNEKGECKSLEDRSLKGEIYFIPHPSPHVSLPRLVEFTQSHDHSVTSSNIRSPLTFLLNLLQGGYEVTCFYEFINEMFLTLVWSFHQSETTLRHTGRYKLPPGPAPPADPAVETQPFVFPHLVKYYFK